MPENLPPTLIEVRAALQTFIESEVVPLEKQYAGSGVPEEVRARIRELSKARGFYYKTQPEEYGGHPAGQLELVVLRECFAANNCHGWSMVFGPGPGILHAADGELKEHYLEPLLRGEKSGAFGFTEPGSAVRPTWAVRRGDRLTINGQKSYVTGGMEADFVSILLNVEDEKGVKEGAAMVVVDRDAPGVIVERAFQSMEGGGHVSLQFDNVEVPLSHVIGKIGEGMPRALGNIGNVRMMVAS
ncbi:MAG: acyl-CoA/acyl-ACP dehydrogenase, partial [Gammaproteobacteria bacterium]|nr:acyl-CoA/acyl-ACP dehydrogenase [Gammaproteobacteria bacterium]